MTPTKKKEVAEKLVTSMPVWCSKTLAIGKDGVFGPTKETQFCAGALIVMKKEGRFRLMRNFVVRLGARFGLFDHKKLVVDGRTSASLKDWLA